MPRPLYTEERVPVYPLYRSRSVKSGERIYLLPLSGIELHFLGCRLRSLVTIPTTSSLLSLPGNHSYIIGNQTLKIITCYIYSLLRTLLEDRNSCSRSTKQVFPCRREFPKLLLDYNEMYLCQVLLLHMISRLKDTDKCRLTFHVNEIDVDHKEINTD